MLADINPGIEELKTAIKKLEALIVEAGGAEYRMRKEDLERVTQRCSEVEKMITRMKATLQNTDVNLLRFDKEIEKEKQEIQKLESANNKLKQDVDKNTQVGEKLLSEMAAIEDEKKRSREELDNRRNNFNNLKREL